MWFADSKKFSPHHDSSAQFDFNPIHGGGSGKNQAELDEQWEAQQAILRARRGEGTSKKPMSKDDLKKKYRSKAEFNIKDREEQINVRQDEAMYIDEESDRKPAFDFKFPWDKK